MFHLTALEIWEKQRGGTEYRPEPFETEGFIHCTDGEDNFIAVGNRYYVSDSRPMLCLSIDATRVLSEIRYEDPEGIFPHIYGPLNLDSVVAVHYVLRKEDGSFVSIGDSAL